MLVLVLLKLMIQVKWLNNYTHQIKEIQNYKQNVDKVILNVGKKLIIWYKLIWKRNKKPFKIN